MIKIQNSDLPGLYQTADAASLKAQRNYFIGITFYLILLIFAALFNHFTLHFESSICKISSTALFLITLFIIVWLRMSRPDKIWYDGRAIAESIKTRTWRWMMRAEPYSDTNDSETNKDHFIADLQIIFGQNQGLIGEIGIHDVLNDTISQKMLEVRGLDLEYRYDFYIHERIKQQSIWYSSKAKYNKKRSEFWFWTTVSLHSLAILFLLYNISEPKLHLPIETIAVAASSVMTWLQSKKHNELSSSYSLAAHEINLIKAEKYKIKSESEFSEYVLNCENAFSREHTQWFARKSG